MMGGSHDLTMCPESSYPIYKINLRFGKRESMAREKKVDNPVALFVTIESAAHDALRTIAFSRKSSLADVVREAVADFVAKQPKVLKDASRFSFAGGKSEKIHA
jgi:hypothetical protein